MSLRLIKQVENSEGRFPLQWLSAYTVRQCRSNPSLPRYVFQKDFYASEGTSGGILKSHRPSIRPSVRPSVSPSVRPSVRPLQIVSQRYLINY